jgi:toxin ParE1/3/4
MKAVSVWPRTQMGRARDELLVNLRSFMVKRYIVFYQPTTAGIEVLRVLHGARDIHRVFDEMVGEASDDKD